MHRIEDIEVWRLDPALLDQLETTIGRSMKMEVARNEGRLYVTVDGALHEGGIALERLQESQP